MTPASLRVPRACIPYVLLQRTGLQRWNRRLPRHAYERGVVHLESRVRRGGIAAAFSEGVVADYEQMAPFLPAEAAITLDIGCGVAGIDVLLHRHYCSGPDLQIHLLDRTQTDVAAFRYGMGDAQRFYNSLSAARDLLVDNGVPAGQVHLWEAASPMPMPPDTAYDLIVSLLSWGHHYPIGTYLDDVARRLRPGGRVILDIRRGTGGEEALQATFPNVQQVGSDAKRVRYVAGAD